MSHPERKILRDRSPGVPYIVQRMNEYFTLNKLPFTAAENLGPGAGICSYGRKFSRKVAQAYAGSVQTEEGPDCRPVEILEFTVDWLSRKQQNAVRGAFVFRKPAPVRPDFGYTPDTVLAMVRKSHPGAEILGIDSDGPETYLSFMERGKTFTAKYDGRGELQYFQDSAGTDH